MRLFLIISVSLSLSLLFGSCSDKQKDPKARKKTKSSYMLNTKLDTLSYCIGENIGQHIRRKGIERMDLVAFAKGIDDALKDRELIISKEEANEIVLEYFQKLHVRSIAKNMKEGEEFLEKNKQKSGIVSLPSGLQYEIIKPGEGKPPKLTNTVTIHYQGRFLNGKVFDSSILKKKPVTFQVSQSSIKAWSEAIPMMKGGSKWRLFVPPHLAYGELGFKNVIEPYETLIFDIELLAVK